MLRNSGQSCNAPTRMLVPRSKMAEAEAIAKRTAEATKVGDPFAEGTGIGPLASEAQFDKVQRLIEKGIEEGAKLVAGGPGRPDGLAKGHFVKPTVFADVRNQMTIAREEIFGPVLCIIPYENEEDAIRIANRYCPYGLSGFADIRQTGSAQAALQSAFDPETSILTARGSTSEAVLEAINSQETAENGAKPASRSSWN